MSKWKVGDNVILRVYFGFGLPKAWRGQVKAVEGRMVLVRLEPDEKRTVPVMNEQGQPEEWFHEDRVSGE